MSTESERDDFAVVREPIETDRAAWSPAREADYYSNALEALDRIESRQHELEARLAEAEQRAATAKELLTWTLDYIDPYKHVAQDIYDFLGLDGATEQAKFEAVYERAARHEKAHEKALREIEAHERLPFGPEVELLDPWSTHNLGGTIESMKSIARAALAPMDTSEWKCDICAAGGHGPEDFLSDDGADTEEASE